MPRVTLVVDSLGGGGNGRSGLSTVFFADGAERPSPRWLADPPADSGDAEVDDDEPGDEPADDDDEDVPDDEPDRGVGVGRRGAGAGLSLPACFNCMRN